MDKPEHREIIRVEAGLLPALSAKKPRSEIGAKKDVRVKPIEIGARFGALTVVGASGSRWECRCDCGRTKIFTGGVLRNGRKPRDGRIGTTSRRRCGHGCTLPYATRVDLIGQRFDRLLVIAMAPPQNKRTRWMCRCDCGTEKLVIAPDLKSGKIRSCGCLMREIASATFKKLGRIHGAANGKKASAVTRKGKTSTMNSQYRQHGSAARSRGFEPMSREVWDSIVSLDCHYCGTRDTRITGYARRVGHHDDAVDIVGVDRLDSSLGYVDGNCVPCCEECNRAKRDTSYADFVAWVRRVARHLGPEEHGEEEG